MTKKFELEHPTDTDPITGYEFESLFLHVGPPAACRVTFAGVRQSGARVLSAQAVEVGDAVEGEPQDKRGDRASRFINAVMAPGFVDKLVANLLAGGELKSKK